MINHVDYLLKDLKKLVENHNIKLTWIKEGMNASISDIENCVNINISYVNIYINDSTEICPICFGTTFMRVTSIPFAQGCSCCGGRGYIDWVDKVLKGK